MSFQNLVEQASVKPQAYDDLELYYEAEKHLDNLGVTLPHDVRVLEMVSSTPKLAVDVLVEVLNVQGFTLKGQKKVIETLRKWWQANNLDTEIQLGLTEALVQGVSYILVGKGDAETPRITLHDRGHVAVHRDLFGNVDEAVIVFGEITGDGLSKDTRTAVHYTPGFRQSYTSSIGESWKPTGPRVSTNISGVPVVPIVNRARLKDARSEGRSEISDLLGLATGESRSLTNLQMAQELLALPQRYLFADGVKTMKDQDGRPIQKFKAYMSALWTGPSGATAGQFPGADLSQIINVLKLYAQKVSAQTGIPPSMLGVSTDNPASAEAMRAAKERLITRAEFKQRLFGDPIEDAMRIALEMYDLLPEDGARTLETSWLDVTTPSRSAKVANFLQAHAQGVISAHLVREVMDLTPEQRAQEDSREASADDLAHALGLGESPTDRQTSGDDSQDEADKESGNAREERVK